MNHNFMKILLLQYQDKNLENISLIKLWKLSCKPKKITSQTYQSIKFIRNYSLLQNINLI